VIGENALQKDWRFIFEVTAGQHRLPVSARIACANSSTTKPIQEDRQHSQFNALAGVHDHTNHGVGVEAGVDFVEVWMLTLLKQEQWI
jgi:hypothetical protein